MGYDCKVSGKSFGQRILLDGTLEIAKSSYYEKYKTNKRRSRTTLLNHLNTETNYEKGGRKWTENVMHGQFVGDTEEIIEKTKLRFWLKQGDLKKGTEALAMTAQGQAKRTTLRTVL